MFLGSRVDDALTLYYRQLLERHEALTLDQLRDAYRDRWFEQLEHEEQARGIHWEPDLDEQAAFQIGLDALELTFAELIPKLGRPVAVQRQLEYTLAPGLEWTVQCHLDLETLREDGEQPVPTVVDYKVKSTPLTAAKADHDPQAGLYLAGRWLEGDPAREFCFAQIAKPGPRRKQISASLVTTRRTTGQLRGMLARIAQAASQICAPARALRARAPVGVRRPQRLEMLAALLLTPRPLPRRRGPVGRQPRPPAQSTSTGARHSNGRAPENRRTPCRSRASPPATAPPSASPAGAARSRPD